MVGTFPNISGEVGVSKGHEPSVLEGQHEHTLDSKGRLSVPADFRLALQLTENDELIVTRHLKERCLLVLDGVLGALSGSNRKRPLRQLQRRLNE